MFADRKAKISKLWYAVGDQNVGRFNVAMNNALIISDLLHFDYISCRPSRRCLNMFMDSVEESPLFFRYASVDHLGCNTQ